MAKKKQFTQFDVLEALDRTAVIGDLFYERVAKHHFVKSKKDIKYKAEMVSELIAEIYQDIGQYMSEE